MQVAPDIDDNKLRIAVQECYQLAVKNLEFLALGADLNTAVYRVVTQDGNRFFLKLRKNDFRIESVEIPAYMNKIGINQVIQVIATTNGKLWGDLSPFKLILYPFYEGKNGFELKMTEKQWVEFGSVIKEFHKTKFPNEITNNIQHENYSSHWRNIILKFLDLNANETITEPIAKETFDFLTKKYEQILELVNRTESLAKILLDEPPETNLCHGDLHGWNLLITNSSTFYIVDWDTLIFAPKEKDLMFIGCGLGGKFLSPNQEESLFYEGYGQVLINPYAMAYYRFERVIEDLAVSCEHIFSTSKENEDRRQSMEIIKSYFVENSPLDHAYQYVKKSLNY